MKNLFYGFALLLMLCGAYSVPAHATSTFPPPEEVGEDAIASCYVFDLSTEFNYSISLSDAVLPDRLWIEQPSKSYLFAILNYNRKVKRMEEEAERVMLSISMEAFQTVQNASSKQNKNS